LPKKKKPRQKEEGPLVLSRSKWHWHNYVKTHPHACVDIQIPQLLRGGIDQQGVDHDNSVLWLESHWKQQVLRWHKIKEVNLHMLGWQ
jgi:hypothetical protein